MWPGVGNLAHVQIVSIAFAGAAEAVATSVLQQLLNPQDAVLGPWVPRRDPLEDALNSFVGSAGGPSPHPWEAGMGFSAGYSGATGESTLGADGFDQQVHCFVEGQCKFASGEHSCAVCRSHIMYSRPLVLCYLELFPMVPKLQRCP